MTDYKKLWVRFPLGGMMYLIFTFSRFALARAKRALSSVQRLKNSAESWEQSVLTVGSLVPNAYPTMSNKIPVKSKLTKTKHLFFFIKTKTVKISISKH